LALDRQSIEKRDFPIGRRGYEPEAVDEHLARLADQVERLERRAEQRNPATVAQAAGAQVQAIVEAAEQTAAEIEREAEDEAQRIRDEAQGDARSAREDAVARSREHVANVGEATALMLQRVEAMESELTALMDSLRTGANRLAADLSLLESSMGDLYGTAVGHAGAAPPAVAVEPPAAPAPPAREVRRDVATDARRASNGAPAGPAEGGQAPSGDIEGARLIALNMALDGQPRDEAARYLADNFDLADADALLDDVYASVEG
jgi:DivIVA domain-containing protein